MNYFKLFIIINLVETGIRLVDVTGRRVLGALDLVVGRVVADALEAVEDEADGTRAAAVEAVLQAGEEGGGVGGVRDVGAQRPRPARVQRWPLAVQARVLAGADASVLVLAVRLRVAFASVLANACLALLLGHLL